MNQDTATLVDGLRAPPTHSGGIIPFQVSVWSDNMCEKKSDADDHIEAIHLWL